jgi:glycosyltransferase involved in cell wall biosynthesis
MRLLVVSYAFPPFNSIGGVRVGKTAKYLLRHGHDVRVLTSRDQPFPATLPLEVPEQNVIYSRYLNVRKPIEGALGERAHAAVSNKPDHSEGALKQLLGFLVRTFVYFPDANIGWLPYATRDLSKLIGSWKPELILASSPPPTGLLVAHHVAKKYKVPWVADLRDLWVDHQYYNQPHGRQLIEEKLERHVFSSATAFVTVSEPLADTLRRKYGKPTAVVLNGFDPADYPRAPLTISGNDELKILYTGVIYRGRQDPSPLFKALKLLGDDARKIKVVFYGSFLGGVLDLAARHGVEHLVEVNSPVPYRESLRMQTEADLLLLLLWTDKDERGVYTGKLFEYVGARRPILALGGEDNVAADFIQERSAGTVLADPGRIAAHLLQCLQQKRSTGSVPAPPERAAVGVTREDQVEVLENFLSGLLHTAQ